MFMINMRYRRNGSSMVVSLSFSIKKYFYYAKKLLLRKLSGARVSSQRTPKEVKQTVFINLRKANKIIYSIAFSSAKFCKNATGLSHFSSG